MTELKLLGMIAALFFGDPVHEADKQLVNIDATPVPAIAPIPQFTKGEVAVYDVKDLRNPFLRASLHRDMKLHVPKKVYVNPNRLKQPLEAYPLDQLTLIGVIKKSRNYDAMIISPDGKVQVVKVGDYLGENHGRVTKVSDDSMVVAEAIPDGMNGYIEYSRTVYVSDKKDQGN